MGVSLFLASTRLGSATEWCWLCPVDNTGPVSCLDEAASSLLLVKNEEEHGEEEVMGKSKKRRLEMEMEASSSPGALAHDGTELEKKKKKNRIQKMHPSVSNVLLSSWKE